MSYWRDKWYWYRHKAELQVWHRVVGGYVGVFLVWGLYRSLSPLPLWVEEVVLKGLVLGGMVWWMGVVKEGMRWRDLGVTSEKLFASVYLGLGLGLVLGLVGQLGNWLRHGGLMLIDHGVSSEMVGGFLLLALVTAFWEGLFFYGYMLTQVRRVLAEVPAVVVVGGAYTLLHVPALVIVAQLAWSEVIKALILLLVLGMANAILMLRMRNLAAPMLAQAVWGVTVFLFR